MVTPSSCCFVVSKLILKKIKFQILGEPSCEDEIKKASTRDEVDGSGQAQMGAKTLCIPLEQVQMISTFYFSFAF